MSSQGRYFTRKLSNGKCMYEPGLRSTTAYDSDSPDSFAGQNVLIVGLGSTAADTACELVGHANKIYLSHRRGNHVVRCTLTLEKAPLLMHVT